MRMQSRPSTRPHTSGNMQTVPSDMPVDEDEKIDNYTDVVSL
jgi:hypothetical protein